MCFLPRCMECRRGLVMRILSAWPSVKRVILTKSKKDLSRFFYHTNEHLAWFSKKKNDWWRATPSTWNFGSTGPLWSKIADFEPIFARSASAVTTSEKSSINTNRKSTTRFPISLRWSSYVPQRAVKKHKVSKILTLSCDNCETVGDRMLVTINH